MSKVRWAASAALLFVCVVGLGGWEAERWESFKRRAVAHTAPANSARLALVGRSAELSRDGADAPAAAKSAVDAVAGAYDEPLAYLVFARFVERPLSSEAWRDGAGTMRPWTPRDREEARAQARRMAELFERGRAKGWADGPEDAAVERIARSEPSLTVAWRASSVLDARRAGAAERQRKAREAVGKLERLASR